MDAGIFAGARYLAVCFQPAAYRQWAGKWRARRDSNARPLASEANTLSI